MKLYVALEHDPFEGDDYLLRLTDSLQEAQETGRATHVVVFDDGLPVEEYYYVPPQKEAIGFDFSHDGPSDECMYTFPLIYSDKVIPGRWKGPQDY